MKIRRDNMYFEKISREQWEKDVLDRMYDDVKLPKRGTKHSAGYDFYCPYDITIPPHSAKIIQTGIRWVCNKSERDRVLLIAPRSGMGFKTGVRLMNTIGVVDAKEII